MDGGGLVRCTACVSNNVESLIEKAEIPIHFHDMTFETFPGEKEALDFAKRYVENGDGYSLYLWGNTGRGKTALSKCILESKIRKDATPGLFITEFELFSRLKLGFNNNTSEKYFDTVKSKKLLVIDDLGMKKKETDWSSDRIMQLIKHRHDARLQTIYTSNCRISDLEMDARGMYLLKESCGDWKYEVLGKNLR